MKFSQDVQRPPVPHDIKRQRDRAGLRIWFCAFHKAKYVIRVGVCKSLVAYGQQLADACKDRAHTRRPHKEG